ncbi:MAG: HD domain-containing protein [Phycisphaerae bacterium]|nr:HD domain-containing protein [Phycisphaerae bacterium]
MRSDPLPNREECIEILRACHVPVHIVKHSKAVAKLGVFLARRLAENEILVNVELVECACLLHDIFRVCEFPLEDFSRFQQVVTEEDKAKWRRLKEQHGGVQHEDAACAYLKDAYPILAQAIRKHRYSAIVDPQDKPGTWEEKLVYYADKRVMHHTIVPLQERLDEAHRRNAARRKASGVDPAEIARIDAAIFALEAELFAPIGLDPDAVTGEFIDQHNAKAGR